MSDYRHLEGKRIRLIEMPHDPCPIPVGAEGLVTGVVVYDQPMPSSYSEWSENGEPIRTQLPAPDVEAQIEVQWDDGRSLFLLAPGDRYEVVEDR